MKKPVMKLWYMQELGRFESMFFDDMPIGLLKPQFEFIFSTVRQYATCLKT
jgi:hypothetical protein